MKEAVRLYSAGEVSLGRAAELAGMNYFLFEELLSAQTIPAMEPEVVNMVTQQELADEVLA